MATLRPLKREIDEVAALLMQGADSPEALAGEVIQLVERLRWERQTWTVVFELSPGVYQGYGPYSTRGMAEKSIPKNPMGQIARRGAIVPVHGESVALAGLEKADEPPSARGDWVAVYEDQRAFKAGWSGRERDKQQFLR